jgi:hypothetical protein
MRFYAVNTRLMVVLLAIGLVSLNPIAVAADVPENFQVVDGVAIYLGVMPAQIVQGHPKEHPEASMHGGVPVKGRRDHVVVALFDNTTGQRIENAQASGSVMEPGLGSKQKKLEPMRIADNVTYGNYFDLSDNNIYHIKLQIRRPGVPDVEATFTHRHFGD